MFQCLGLGTEQDGGCGEDWWHPECVLGQGRGRSAGTKSEMDPRLFPQVSSPKINVEEATEEAMEESTEIVQPLPPGFPQEEEFEAFICYKCVEANPWIKKYAGTSGFLKPAFRITPTHRIDSSVEDKRTLEEIKPFKAQTQEDHLTSNRTPTESGDNGER